MKLTDLTCRCECQVLLPGRRLMLRLCGACHESPFMWLGCRSFSGESELSNISARTSDVEKYSTAPALMKPTSVEEPPMYFPWRWRPFLSCMESAAAIVEPN